MLSSVLRSPTAIAVNVEIMRVFVRLIRPDQPVRRPIGFVTDEGKPSS